MSVLIKGMVMPKACEWCRFISGGLEWYCDVGKMRIYDYKSIHKDCPLVEVPTPHGDLIDRDDLIDEINRIYPSYGMDYEAAYSSISQADIIIEAEEEK